MPVLPKSLIIHPRSHDLRWSAICSTDCLKRQWDQIITDEQQAYHKSQSHLKSAVVIAFATNNTLPKDIALEVVSFMNTNINHTTIIRISRLLVERRKWEISTNGQAVSRRRCPREKPRLLFSQPDFHKQIRERAHQVLFRQLNTNGDMETQLSTFVNYLVNKS